MIVLAAPKQLDRWLQGRRHRWFVRWVPNGLTILRAALISVAAAICLLDYLAKSPAVWPYVLTAGLMVTDYLDGKWARRYNVITEFGKIADPAADKVTLIAVLGSFVAALMTAPLPAAWKAALVVVAVIRIGLDLHLVRLALIGKRRLKSAGLSPEKVPGANRWGKRKFWTDCVTVAAAWGLLRFSHQPSWQAAAVALVGLTLASSLAVFSIRGHIVEFYQLMGKLGRDPSDLSRLP